MNKEHNKDNVKPDIQQKASAPTQPSVVDKNPECDLKKVLKPEVLDL